MTIGFDGIPSNKLVPFFYSEFNNKSATGSQAQTYKGLLIGQKLAGGTAEVNTRYRVTSESEADKLWGQGSMLARMFKAFKKNDKTTDLYCIALADNAAGVVATKTVTFSGPATKAGTLVCYLGAQRITIGVAVGDTPTVIATNVKDAINALPELPFSAANAAGVLTLSFKHKGEVGSTVDVRFNFYMGEQFPEGVSVVIAEGVAGVGNPDVTTAIAALGTTQYNIIGFPYVDLANLNLMETELKKRWGPMYQIEGALVAMMNKNFSATSTFMAGRNSFLECIANCFGSPTPTYELAAMAAAQVALSAAIDPARPFQTLELAGALAPKEEDQFDSFERDLLLKDGVATLAYSEDGKVLIERMVTTYTTNEFGAPDPSYRDINTILTLSYLRWDQRNYFLRKYPRHKLAKDGGNYGPGQPVMTPKLYKAELLVLFREWEKKALVENVEQFLADLIVEIDSTDKNRINSLSKPDLVNQLMVHANQIAFIL